MSIDIPATQPVARLEVQWREESLEIRPCFTGKGQHVQFELNIHRASPAGSSHSRQSGNLRLSPEQLCPATSRQNVHADQQVSIQLRWWMDSQPQPDIHKRISADSRTTYTHTN